MWPFSKRVKRPKGIVTLAEEAEKKMEEKYRDQYLEAFEEWEDLEEEVDGKLEKYEKEKRILNASSEIRDLWQEAKEAEKKVDAMRLLLRGREAMKTKSNE